MRLGVNAAIKFEHAESDFRRAVVGGLVIKHKLS